MMGDPLNPVCWCGHVVDEHESGFFKPCIIDGCKCEDFESEEEE